MFNITKKSMEWGGRTLTLETGRIARQADGAVLATYGDTSVLATVVGAKVPDPKFDFFPLTCSLSGEVFRFRPHSRRQLLYRNANNRVSLFLAPE